MQDNRVEYLVDEQKRTQLLVTGHGKAAVRVGRWGMRFAVTAATLSATVGTTVFASLEKEVDIRIRFAVGFVSLLAAVFTALQSVLRFAERSEEHRTASAEYRSVVREIQNFLVDYRASDRTMTDEQARTTMDLIRKRLDDLDRRALGLSERDAAPPGDNPANKVGATAA